MDFNSKAIGNLVGPFIFIYACCGRTALEKEKKIVWATGNSKRTRIYGGWCGRPKREKELEISILIFFYLDYDSYSNYLGSEISNWIRIPICSDYLK